MADLTEKRRLRDAVVPFFEKAVFANFFLGMAEAFPKALIGTVLGYWLADENVDVVVFGIFSGLTLPYALKLFWAPVADRMPLPPITTYLGRRRGWLTCIIVLMSVCILAIGFTGPSQDTLFAARNMSYVVPESFLWDSFALGIQWGNVSGIYFTGMMVVGIAYLGATQDVIIDAYRLEIMEERQMGHGATAITFGYRAMGLLLGWAAVRYSDVIGWPMVFTLCLVCFLPLIFTLIWVGEPKHQTSEYLEKAEREAHQALAHWKLPNSVKTSLEWLYGAVYLPFSEFITRERSWLLILLFVILFKAGDAVVSALLTKFLVETGFSKVVLADIKQAVGGVMLWVGVFCSALLYGWLGLYRSLLVTSILMAVTNLAFAWISIIGPDPGALAIAISAESFASGLSNVAIVAFLSQLCSKEYAATQYALLSSLSALSYSLVGFGSGYMQRAFGWYEFYLVSALSAVPAILLLLWIWKRAADAAKVLSDTEREEAGVGG